MKYKRVVLKITGEVLPHQYSTPINFISEEIREATDLGAQIAIVVGAGNILRGNQISSSTNISHITGDYMGLLATVINGLALQDTLESDGLETCLMSAIHIQPIIEAYNSREAIKYLNKGRVLILAGGTGSPGVTTDTAAALRAVELNADAVLKATKVNGVYDKDPQKYQDANFYECLTYQQFLNQQLAIMDSASIALCMQHKIPVVVYNINKKGNTAAVIRGDKIGTLIADQEEIKKYLSR